MVPSYTQLKLFSALTVSAITRAEYAFNIIGQSSLLDKIMQVKDFAL